MFSVSEDLRQNELYQDKSNLLDLSSQWNQKYFHLNTVDNLIFHFSEIGNEVDKEWVYGTLKNYLETCKHITENISRQESNQLYEEFLFKIVEYYRTNLEFSIIGGWTLFNLIYLTLFVVLYLVFNLLIALLTVPLYVARAFFIYKKYKEKKVYGPFY